jgi:hypothetical protein
MYLSWFKFLPISCIYLLVSFIICNIYYIKYIFYNI